MANIKLIAFGITAISAIGTFTAIKVYSSDNQGAEKQKKESHTFEKYEVYSKVNNAKPYFLVNADKNFDWSPENNKLICEYKGIKYECKVSKNTYNPPVTIYKNNSTNHSHPYDIDYWKEINELPTNNDSQINLKENFNYKITFENKLGGEMEGDANLIQNIFNEIKSSISEKQISNIKIKGLKNQTNLSIKLIANGNQILFNKELHETKTKLDWKKKVDRKTENKKLSEDFLNSTSSTFKKFDTPPLIRYKVTKSGNSTTLSKSECKNKAGSYLLVSPKSTITFFNQTSPKFKCTFGSTEYDCTIAAIPFEIDLKTDKNQYTAIELSKWRNLESIQEPKARKISTQKTVTDNLVALYKGFNYKVTFTNPTTPTIIDNSNSCSTVPTVNKIKIKQTQGTSSEVDALISIFKSNDCVFGNTQKFKN